MFIKVRIQFFSIFKRLTRALMDLEDELEATITKIYYAKEIDVNTYAIHCKLFFDITVYEDDIKYAKEEILKRLKRFNLIEYEFEKEV